MVVQCYEDKQLAMMTPTTMNDSNLINTAISSMVQQVAEAAAAAVFENGVEKLPPPTHTVYFLRNKHDRKLSIVMGEVKISSISMPEKHVTLTTSRWVVNVTCFSGMDMDCLLYTSPSPRDRQKSRMPSSA